jgi:hypothetical protein
VPIPVSCSCGRALKIKDELAGKKVRCPACRNVVQVPQPNQDPEDEIMQMLLSDSEDEPAPPSSPEPPEPEGIKAEAPQRASPPSPPPSLPKKKPEKKPREPERRQPRVVFEEGWFGSVNSGVIGGLLMMVIAVVWFVLGLMANRIFFYPPILLVIGLISMIKGFFGDDG